MSYEVQSFENDVIERSRQVPVLVDFWAPWCGPCKMLGPIIEKLAKEAGGAWELIKVNTDEKQDLAMRYQIQGIPNLKLFVDGEVVAEQAGMAPEPQLKAWIEENIPSAQKSALTEIEELLLTGQHLNADAHLKELEAQGAINDPKLPILKAEIALVMEPAKVENCLQDIRPGSEFFNQAQALLTLSSFAHLAEKSHLLPEGNGQEHAKALANALHSANWSAAFSALLDLMAENAKYLDHMGARAGKALVQYLGIRHPEVDKHYQALSNALFK